MNSDFDRDPENGEHGEPASEETDVLEVAMRAAFGADPETDTPTSRSVLEVFRRAGYGSRIQLRDADSEHTPLALPGRAEGELSWTSSRCQVAGEIARGGVGSVLKARDTDLGRDVALKVLLDAHRGNAEMTRRFLEEAQIAGQLQHPGVVAVHEIGLLADDRPYFAMKLVNGQTLAELLESRTGPEDGRQRFLGVFEQVCQTLAYAHSRGVIHRDLKPSNVMVGAFGEVQVMDWGLAKVLAKGGVADELRTTRAIVRDAESKADEQRITTARDGSDSSQSLAGSVMGTPAYMPTEQARGAVDELDERSDVFGLGAILCEILTGRPPYTGRDLDEVFRKARSGDLAEARRRLGDCGADEALVDIAESCLRPEARERPRNAVVVAKRVREYLESIDRRARELEMRAAKARLRLSLALVGLVAVVIGAGAFFWIDRERRAQRDTAVAAVREALGDAKQLRARAASGGDAATWEAALREARRAVDLASRSAASSMRAEAESFHAELAAQVRDRTTIALLEQVREEKDVGPGEVDERFREAFSEHGIDVEDLDVETAARMIRDSGIRTELVLALDEWAMTKRRPRDRSGLSRSARRLLEVAQSADDDPFRRRLREAVQAQDEDLLESLAGEAATRQLAPSTFELLALALRDSPRARQLWKRAQELYPHDFWITIRLGDRIDDDGDHVEALQYLRAAVALRPGSAYARYKLGSTLADASQPGQSIGELGAAFTLDPYLFFGWPYYKCAGIVADNAATITPGELDRLETTLETIRRGGDYHRDGLDTLLAAVRFVRGDREGAILVLEESFRERGERSWDRWRFPRGRERHETPAEALARYRQSVLPDLVSFASIDVALEADGALDQFRALHAGSTDAGALARLAYLDGRLLQRAGRHREAAAKFEEAFAREDALPEPHLRLAESLRDAGDAAAAEVALRGALSRESLQYSAPWTLWTELSLVALRRSAREILATFPALPAVDGERDDSPLADLRWALERLVAGEPLRINCGGDATVDARGATWGRDRFARSEIPGMRRFGERWRRDRGRRGDEPPERSSRVFFGRGGDEAGYRIPLPAGRYDVTLHFAARRHSRGRADESPAFAVVVEGAIARAAYEPPSPGTASADVWSVETGVEDGFLDIQFVRRRGEPAVAAIEVARRP